MGWVGCVAAAALGCYLVSQRVASERGAVERLDRRIVMARIEIRKLQTELGTRSRMPVLEKWNSDVLALSAPSAHQYLHGEVQLANFEVAPAPMPSVQQAVAHEDVRAPAKVVTVAASAPTADQQPLLRHATYVKPSDEFASGVRQAALLDDTLLGDLRQAAQSEKRGSNEGR
jgi:hypothetical protein